MFTFTLYISDPDEECYYSKHVDHAVIYIHVYIINRIQQSSTTSVVELGIHIPHLFIHISRNIHDNYYDERNVNGNYYCLQKVKYKD